MNVEHLPGSSQFPSTPLDALQDVVQEKVIVEGRTFLIDRPAESDRLMDHPAIRSAYVSHQYLPYWTDLWPASRMLAKIILREPWAAGLDALEIGCGLGLPGIAAMAAGLRVIFTDADATALHFAARNARANGFDRFRLMTLDWNNPPADFRVPVVLGSDLIYEIRNVEPLVGLISRILEPDGICLLTDQDRIPAHVLHEALPQAKLTYTATPVKAGEPGGRRLKGTLYRIQHAGERRGVSPT
jgi:predicted nicotinamide N-methyase